MGARPPPVRPASVSECRRPWVFDTSARLPTGVSGGNDPHEDYALCVKAQGACGVRTRVDALDEPPRDASRRLAGRNNREVEAPVVARGQCAGAQMLAHTDRGAEQRTR